MLQKTKPPMPKQKDPPLSRTISEPDQPAPPPPRHGHERIHKRAPIPEPINTQDSDDSSSVKKISSLFQAFTSFPFLFCFLSFKKTACFVVKISIKVYNFILIFFHSYITEFSTQAFIVYWPY